MHRYFRWFGLPGKTVLTTLLSLLACSLYLLSPGMPRLLCAAAMLFSSLGDFSLMSETPLGKRRKKPQMIVGGIFFAVAHLCYTAAAAAAAYSHGAFRPYSGLVVGGALFAAGLLSLFILGGKTGVGILHLSLGSCYLFLICLNCATVFAYALGAGGMHLPACAGAISFFISDYLIGLHSFGNFPWLKTDRGNNLIWWFYVLGQALLILFIY